MIIFDLQRIRKEKNVTQRELAEMTSYPQGFISEIENGKASAPEAFINKVAEIFNIADIKGYIKEEPNVSARKEKNSKRSVEIAQEIVKHSKLAPLDFQTTKEDSHEITITKAMFTTIIDSLLKKDKKIEELEHENQLLKEQLKSRKT